jgi:hypothetical protein
VSAMAADIFTFCPRPLPTPERGRTSRALRELDEWRSCYAELLARYSRSQALKNLDTAIDLARRESAGVCCQTSVVASRYLIWLKARYVNWAIRSCYAETFGQCVALLDGSPPQRVPPSYNSLLKRLWRDTNMTA